MNVQNEIDRFIIEDLLSGSKQDLEPDTSLYGSGTLDSLGTLRLITFIEERFGLQVGDGDVGEENFGTPRRLSAFVERKLAESQKK